MRKSTLLWKCWPSAWGSFHNCQRIQLCWCSGALGAFNDDDDDDDDEEEEEANEKVLSKVCSGCKL
jgi:hypothetical protein